jgi:A/G-specific adenine glycosylase
MNSIHIKRFTNLLLTWHENVDRDLPWKETKDPYKIWLSEIILQQTRVEQGKPYYFKFISLFPTVHSLANALQEDVMKAWEGLGYYSRARNLHQTAKYIALELNGIFPTTYETILQLKGVGPYTAAAIASFAYNLPYPVMDGNVLRVMTRFYGIGDPIDHPKTQKEIQSILNRLLPKDSPDKFNQAMMDMGATVCKPKLPECSLCPLSQYCQANIKNEVALYPFKSKKIIKKDRYFHYLVIHHNGSFLIAKRIKDIWQGLYEFPLIETSSEVNLTRKEINSGLNDLAISSNGLKIIKIHTPVRHILTHQNLIITFYELKISEIKTENINLVERKKLSKFAFPIIIKNFLDNNLKTEQND